MLARGERRETNILGVFLLKLPSSRTRQAAVAIEINPVDSAGSDTNSFSSLQAGVSWLRFNCAKARLTELEVTPFGRWKLSIVLISFWIA